VAEAKADGGMATGWNRLWPKMQRMRRLSGAHFGPPYNFLIVCLRGS
jgi:hypothetical protein